MEILVVSDWHGLNIDLPNCNPDLLISLGDMYENCIRFLDQKFSCKKIGVLGNHDSFHTYEGTDFDFIHEKLIEFNGLKLFGFGGCPRYSNKNAPQYDDDYVEFVLQDVPHVDIFVAHANPRLDNVVFDEQDPHRGFDSFTKYILEKQPKLFLHGHIHEVNTKHVNNTVIENVHPYRILHL